MKNLINNRDRLTIFGLFGLVIFLYAYTYAMAPFAETTNAVIVNGATTLAALTSAIILTRITFYFQRNELPFVIWAAFAVCMWLWTVAEG